MSVVRSVVSNAGNLSLSVRFTWPKYVNLRTCNKSTMSFSTDSSFSMSTFLLLFFVAIPQIVLSTGISKSLNFLLWFLANVNLRSRSLYAISRPSVVCLLSVTLVHPTQAVAFFGNFFSPYDSPGTLLFWCQKSLVGDAPFPLKFAFKVTHPL